MFNLRRRVVGHRDINRDKVDLIDEAFSTHGVKSFADLGGVWAVEGAYTFHALDEHEVEKAALVDTHLTPQVIARAEAYPQLRLIDGNFGEQSIIDQLGKVDALFLFDVLLHQVSPDWNLLLEMLTPRVNVLIIFNQQWTGSNETVRLLDLGEDEYFRNVPHGRKSEPYKDLFQKLDQKHPDHNRTWRDVHHIWQWGITDADLEKAVDELGFKLVYKKNYGRFGRLPYFENHGFIFAR